MRVLIADNHLMEDSFGASALVRLCQQLGPSRIEVRRGPEDDLPEISSTEYDRILISGSYASVFDEAPWTKKLDGWIRKCAEERIPTLGICYGHQAMVRALGGRQLLGPSQKPEYGWTRFKKTQDSKLLSGLPEKFYSFSSHREEALELPKPFLKICESQDCSVQGFQINGEPLYGLQFHPEKDLDGAQESYSELKSAQLKKAFLHYRDGRKYYNPEIGKTILRNFFES